MQYGERSNKLGCNRIVVTSVGQKKSRTPFLHSTNRGKRELNETMFKRMKESGFVKPKLLQKKQKNKNKNTLVNSTLKVE